MKDFVMYEKCSKRKNACAMRCGAASGTVSIRLPESCHLRRSISGTPSTRAEPAPMLGVLSYIYKLNLAYLNLEKVSHIAP